VVNPILFASSHEGYYNSHIDGVQKMNDLLGTLAKMPPEQLIQLLLAVLTTVVAPIVGVFILFVRWALKQQDRKHAEALKAQEADRTEKLNKQQGELDNMRRQMDLKFQEQEAQSQQITQAFELLGKQMEGINNLADAQRETNRIHAEIESRRSQDVKTLNDKISGVGDILEVQSSHFQSLTSNIQEVKSLKLDFENVRIEIAAHKEKVDSMISRLDKALDNTIPKGDLAQLRQSLDESHAKIDRRIDELLAYVKEMQEITEPIQTIIQEKEEAE